MTAQKGTTKSKEKKPCPSQQTADELGRHEKVVQDRIAGKTVSQLSKLHGYSRSAIRDILNKNNERIEQAVKAHLEERQEQIDQAMNLDVQEMASQLFRSTQLLGQVIDRIEELLKQGEEMKARDLAALGDVAVKAFDRVHAVVLNQQKEADKG